MELLKPVNRRELIGAVYGTLLGDSSLCKPTHCNSRVSGAHKEKEYAEFKAKIIGAKVSQRKDGYWNYRTPRLPMYSKIYPYIYYNGRKTVTPHVLKALTPLGIALWYFDDGSLVKDKTRPHGYKIYLYTCAFNTAEHLLIQKMLNDNFSFRFSIIKHGNYNRLRLKNDDRYSFFELIKSYCPECMAYKVPTTEEMEFIKFYKDNKHLSKYSLSRAAMYGIGRNDQSLCYA